MKTARQPLLALAFASAPGALLALPACSSLETTVEVRNDTSRRIVASLELDRVAARADVLARETIGAGGATVLGPVETPPLEKAELRVSTPGDVGTVDRTLTLPRGRSVVVVDADAWGSVSARLLGDADSPGDTE